MIRAAQARIARRRYREMAAVLNEQSRRRFVALEARALGRGGVSLMARITGLARRTRFIAGLDDIRINPFGRAWTCSEERWRAEEEGGQPFCPISSD